MFKDPKKKSDFAICEMDYTANKMLTGEFDSKTNMYHLTAKSQQYYCEFSSVFEMGINSNNMLSILYAFTHAIEERNRNLIDDRFDEGRLKRIIQDLIEIMKEEEK